MWEKIQESLNDESNKVSSIRIIFYASLLAGLIFSIAAVVFMVMGYKDAGNMAWNVAMGFSLKGGLEAIASQWKSAKVSQNPGSLKPATNPTPDPSDIRPVESPDPEPKVMPLKDGKRFSESSIKKHNSNKRKIKRLLAQITLSPAQGEFLPDRRPSFLLVQRHGKAINHEPKQ